MITFGTIDLSQLIYTILATVVLGAIAGAGTALRSWLKQNATATQIANIGAIVRWAVLAAEQTGLSKTGAEKKSQAMDFAVSWLEANGIKVNRSTLDLLDTAIEAAVKLEFGQTLPAPTDGVPPVPPEPATP